MARIKVDVDGLRNYVNVLQGRVNEYEALNDRMNSLSSTILAGWEGDASKAFAEMMAQYAAQAAELTSILEQFRTYAMDAADRFERTDTDGAAKIKSSF